MYLQVPAEWRLIHQLVGDGTRIHATELARSAVEVDDQLAQLNLLTRQLAVWQLEEQLGWAIPTRHTRNKVARDGATS